jgi:hypothetical protein
MRTSKIEEVEEFTAKSQRSLRDAEDEEGGRNIEHRTLKRKRKKSLPQCSVSISEHQN